MRFPAGFTLTETMVYILLLGLIVTAVVSLAAGLMELRTRHLAMQEAGANIRLIKSALSGDFYPAEEIIAPAAAATGSRLVLRAEGGRLVEYYFEQERLMRHSGGSARAISGPHLVFKDAIFANYGTGEQAAIRLSATAEYPAGRRPYAEQVIHNMFQYQE